jgi:hypothetical protein
MLTSNKTPAAWSLLLRWPSGTFPRRILSDHIRELEVRTQSESGVGGA